MQVVGDGFAQCLERQIVDVVAEGVFDFHADLFHTQQDVGDQQQCGNCGPAEVCHQCHRQCDEIDDQGPSQVDHVGEGQGSVVNSLARPQRVDQPLQTPVEHELLHVADESAPQRCVNLLGHLHRDRHWDVLCLFDFLHF